MNNEKVKQSDLDFNQLVSKTNRGALDNAFISSSSLEMDMEDALKMGQDYENESKRLRDAEGNLIEIDGLKEHGKIKDFLQNDLKPIREIFNMAKDMVQRSQRFQLKNNFSNKEEIQVKNDANIKKSLWGASLIFMALVLLLAVIFKSRIFIMCSFLAFFPALLTSISNYKANKKLNIFKQNKYGFVNSDMKELKLRLLQVKDDVSYYKAIRSMDVLPSFQSDFIVKFNYLTDLMTEYEAVNANDFEKKLEYYNEIISVLEKMTEYEKNVFDTFIRDTFNKH